jgi:aldehyde dehydrogenase (NAD+)
LRVGDPSDESTDLGPVISEGSQTRIRGLLRQAEEAGWGKVTSASLSRSVVATGGYFVAPAVVSDVDMGSPVAQNEIFGPVLCAAPFKDVDEALTLANDTEYGLAGYLFTGDAGLARYLSPRIEASCISVNRSGGVPTNVPFGGMKGSGFGREGGYAGLAEFLRPRTIIDREALVL